MDEIKEIIYSCAEDFNVTINKIILFGSRAKGNYDENSDYDILIVLNDDIENYNKIKLSCIITRKLADIWINADIIVKSLGEISKYENCIGSVIRVALNEGVLV